jgi:hypothetical protein
MASSWFSQPAEDISMKPHKLSWLDGMRTEIFSNENASKKLLSYYAMTRVSLLVAGRLPHGMCILLLDAALAAFSLGEQTLPTCFARRSYQLLLGEDNTNTRYL